MHKWHGRIWAQVVLICLLIASPLLYADQFTSLTNMWYQGAKSNVTQYGEQRLAMNTNDIVGLVLGLESDLSFSNDGRLSNSIERVLSVGRTISTPNFSNEYNRLRGSLLDMLEYLPSYPVSELEADRAKALIPHKPMNFQRTLSALHDDGWLTEPTQSTE